MPEATPWRTGTLARAGGARVLFGWSYEDERIELEAFGDPAPDGPVCVIAAAGETAAACAAAGHHVTAVDINPRQLAYAQSRLDGAPARAGLAELGMTAGRSALGLLVPAWRRATLLTALADAEPAAAQAYWRERLDRGAFPTVLRSLIGPGGMVLRAVNPPLAASLPPRFDQVVRRRIEQGLGRHGLTGNRFAWRLLAGRELPGWRPPTGGTVDLVRADIADHLEQAPAGHYAGISLSNVLDGASPAFASRLRAAAARALAPGGAIVLRSFGAADDPGRARDDAAMLWGVVSVLRPR